MKLLIQCLRICTKKLEDVGIDLLEYILDKYPNSIYLKNDHLLRTIHLRSPNALKLSIKILKKVISSSESNEEITDILEGIEEEKYYILNNTFFKDNDLIKQNNIFYTNITSKITQLLNNNKDHEYIVNYLNSMNIFL